jgi:predicted CopG family antitoxin
MLSRFIKDYADKPTEKFLSYIKDIAADRGLEIKPSIMESQKSARNWLKHNMDHATLKAIGTAEKLSEKFDINMPKKNDKESISNFIDQYATHATMKAINKAYELSDKYNVDIPKNLDRKSINDFIREYGNKPTEKMNQYARMISEHTGISINDEIKNDKEKLSNWISDNHGKARLRSDEIKLLASYSPNDRDLEDIKEKYPNVKDEAIIRVIKSGVDFPKDKLNDNEYKLNFLRAHAEFKDSPQWTKVYEKLKSNDRSIQKETISRGEERE